MSVVGLCSRTSPSKLSITFSTRSDQSCHSFSLHVFVRYNLELIRYEGRIKENLASLAKGHPNIKAVLMGTRKTDPYSGGLLFLMIRTVKKGALLPFNLMIWKKNPYSNNLLFLHLLATRAIQMATFTSFSGDTRVTAYHQ